MPRIRTSHCSLLHMHAVDLDSNLIFIDEIYIGPRKQFVDTAERRTVIFYTGPLSYVPRPYEHKSSDQ